MHTKLHTVLHYTSSAPIPEELQVPTFQ